jgi:NHLM bacteriocin system ABC transporter ATP-binding protein
MKEDTSTSKNLKKGTSKDDLQDIKSGYLYRKLSKDNTLLKLSKLINANKTELKVDKYSEHDSYELLLIKTCQIVGDIEKIKFISGFDNASKDWDPLKKILRASNIRSRKLILNENWWLHDYGPLLAFLKIDKIPVALIWKNKKYVLINLKTGETEIVNRTNSTNIETIVHSFFTPLPKGKLTKSILLKFILGFTKKDLTFFLVLGILGGLMSLLIPLIAGYIFNVIVPGGIKGSLYEIGFLLFSIVVILSVINIAREIAVLRFEGKSSYKLQSAVWDRILVLKVPFFDQYDAGDLAERSLSIETVRKILSAKVMTSIVAAIFSIFYLMLMFYYDFTLTILALCLGLIIAIFTLVISKLVIPHIRGFLKLKVIISGFMMTVFSGIQKIRMTASENRVIELWANKYSQQKDHYIARMKLMIIVSVFTFGFPIFSTLLIYLRVYDLFTLPQLVPFTIGDFIAFNSAYLSFQGALVAAFMIAIPLMSIKPALDLLDPILEAETEDYDDKKDVGKLTGDIEISNLKFKYKGTDNLVLKDISLKIKEGQFVAIVGGSGSGKSTLLRILLGFEDYQQGVILFNGLDFKTLDIRTIRDQIGVVLQDGKIMEGSVLYNIIGTSNYTVEDAWEAARLAGCDTDINNLEEKMDTLLPAGGGVLSGGQQQRIVIARALIRKPKLFLFDEATSALDNSTQQTVTDSLNTLNATKIVIAHRLSTIKDADVIFVLEKGKIIEEGDYKTLIENKNFFYDLVKKQLH